MPPLHTGTGDIRGDKYLSAMTGALRWGRLPCAGETPVVTLNSGQTITVDTVSHEGLLDDQGADPVTFFGEYGIAHNEILDDVRELAGASLVRNGDDGPHVVLGPISIAGARPGDVLCVEQLGLTRRVDYGIISNRHGLGVLAGEMPESSDLVCVLGRVGADERAHIALATGRQLRFDLRLQLGLVGVTPGDGCARSSTPPGDYGGNLDIRYLGVGSALLLPVQVPDAGLYLGDPHFAQGNGEVALTALEAPLRADLRVTVLSDRDARRLAQVLASPWAQTSTHTILVGLGGTLDEAMRDGVRRALAYVCEVTGADRASALAFLSASADFEVSQAVNGVVGVHCLLRTSDLR
ncbi:Formamidase [Mycobacterium simulans]|uniref:acetamidase/formamidase family protein n=1 Tax=Mycobacterium simulans TaxID=627089 RepID=UPI00174B9E34|nr:acetamidase/formamidase family protein [Mycobacterium simulans]SON59918.1 Formamidase [Mycobacterium simulans]